jgi:hypothetical protein
MKVSCTNTPGLRSAYFDIQFGQKFMQDSHSLVLLVGCLVSSTPAPRVQIWHCVDVDTCALLLGFLTVDWPR